MKNKFLTIILTLALLSLSVASQAKEELKFDDATALPLPRFVSLAADEVNVRTGPGIRYPIRFVFKKEKLPVEIIREFDIWRQVRSKDGDQGWVHKSLLSGKRRVIVKGALQILFEKPDPTTRPVVKLEPDVIAGLDRCEKEWCYLQVASYKGWIKRENLWGVYSDEKFSD